MTPERWQQVREVLHGALQLAPEQRPAFLHHACPADDGLRREVESLLVSGDEGLSAFLKSSPIPVTLTKGTRLGDYEVQSLLGSGGMGEVYRAHDMRLDRDVAIKVLPGFLSTDPGRLYRFEQEARAAAALSHPNILGVFQLGSYEGAPYLVSELLDGETLRKQLCRGPLPESEVVEYGAQITEGLAAAHGKGILHRDLKPENLFLTKNGGIKILDFGLAKLTRPGPEATTLSDYRTEPGLIMGTLGYMSPEQARGEELDARSDLFSLGAVLYEMATGRQAFPGNTPAVILEAVLDRDPKPICELVPGFPNQLARIVAKTLEKDRESRYSSATDLCADLKELRHGAESGRVLLADVAGRKDGGTPASAAPEESLRVRNKFWQFFVLVAAALLATGLGVTFYTHRAHPLSERDSILLADFVNTTNDSVFEGTLKQALAVKLGESPYLNIVPQEAVRNTLRLMDRLPEESLNPTVAREVCQRQRTKALVTGFIASLGSHYVISLEAVNCQTGDTLAREQVEVETKEQVLGAVGRAGLQLRRKLGESLGSIQQFDAPIEQTTTSSLEALKSDALGQESLDRGDAYHAIPFFKRAVEIDPNFATAYARLGASYWILGEDQIGAGYMKQAYTLRERASEPEEFYIQWRYYSGVTRESSKAAEILEMWKMTYPRDFAPHNILAGHYGSIGQFDKSGDEARQSLRLNPNYAGSYESLAWTELILNRFDEAKDTVRQAMAQKMDGLGFRNLLFSIAFAQNDDSGMREQLEWFKGRSEEAAALGLQAGVAHFHGQSKRASALIQPAIEAAERAGFRNFAAAGLASTALAEALLGDCGRVHEQVARSSAISNSPQPILLASLALSTCGDVRLAQIPLDELASRYPSDFGLNSISLPIARASIELARGKSAAALESLQGVEPYERAALQAVYLRGLAHLSLRHSDKAAKEFQRVLDSPGEIASEFLGSVIESPLIYPLSYLGLARAKMLVGDIPGARKAYQDLFALWKDADPDLSVLKQAKSEYAKL